MIESIKVDGVDYSVDDFTGGELVDAEREFGISLMFEMERASMAGVYALIYIIKHRSDPAFTSDDALELKLGDLQKMLGTDDDVEGEGEQAPPPNRAARRAKRPQTAGTSGSQSS